MAESNIQDVECGFCWLKFKDMVDPRELPCGHTFCVPCLEGNYESNGVRCKVCQKFHALKDFETLKKVEDDAGMNSGEPELICDRGGCKNPVCYCEDCDEKLCESHMQVHKSYFKEDHTVVSIERFKEVPEKYKKVFCSQHPKELITKICKLCDKFACNGCDSSEGECSGTSTQHEYITLNTLDQQIITHFKKLLKAADDMKSKIAKLDKGSWEKLNVVAEECNNWVKEMEQYRDELIVQVTKQSAVVTDKIQSYLTEVIADVKSFNSDLVVKKEQLEESRTKLHKLMRDGHVTEKVSQKQQITDEVTEKLNRDLGSCEIPKDVTLVMSKKSWTMDVDFINFPQSLTLCSEIPTDGRCLSTCHREDGNILVGSEKGVSLYNRKTKKLTKCNLPYQKVLSIIEHRHAVYILHRYAPGKWRVEMCLPNLKHAQTLLEFEDDFGYMTVSNRYIVVSVVKGDGTTYTIIYDLLSKKTLPARYCIGFPCFQPDGTLLGVGLDVEVTQYNIDEGVLSAIWTCTGLEKVSSACVDSLGLIYATTNDNKHIHIVSPEGEKLQTLTHDGLPNVPGSISIRGDELLIPDMRNPMLLIYKINK